MNSTKTTLILIITLLLVIAIPLHAQDTPPAPAIDLESLAVIGPENVDRLERLHRFELDTAFPFVTADRQSNRVVMSRNGDWIDVWDIDSGQMVSVANAIDLGYNRFAFSADGTMLAVTGGERVVVWDLTIQQMISELPTHELGAEKLAFSPDGTMLATTDGYIGPSTGLIFLWDVATGESLGTLEEPDSNSPGYWSVLAFNPESGDLLSFINQTLYLWDPVTLELHREFYDLGFTAYGTRAQYIGEGTGILAFSGAILYVLNAELTDIPAVLPLPSAGGLITNRAISADASMLATVSDEITALYTLLPVPQLVAQWPLDSVALTFTPDGSLLLAGTKDGKTVAWDQEGTRVETFSLLDDGLELSILNTSPNGKLLLVASRTPDPDSGSFLDVWGIPED